MLDFPSSPTIGQKYPTTPVTGVPQYVWDGEKWITQSGAASNKQPVYDDGSVPMTGQLKLAGDPVAPEDAVRKAWALAISGGQVITGGFRFTPYNIGGIIAGQTYTLNAFNGNYQYSINSGAHTIAAPGNDCAIDLLVTNGVGAGVITFSGFTVGANTGDLLTTTNGHRFIVSVRRINAISTYVIKALQ